MRFSLLRWTVRHWMSGLVGLVIGVSAGSAVLFYASTRPPLIIEGIETADDVVQSDTKDDTISFVAHIDRQRSCPVLVSRFLWRWVSYEGKPIREFRGIDNPPLTPMPGRGQQDYMLTLRVPSDLPAGQWFERTVTITQCQFLSELLSDPPRVSPDRPITVLGATP